MHYPITRCLTNIDLSRTTTTTTTTTMRPVLWSQTTTADDWTSDLSEWMTNLPQPLHCTPLNLLAIPGSHDSGAYTFDPRLPIAPDESAIIRRFANIINIMPLSKYQVESITLKNCGNFLYIGKFVIFPQFRFTKNGCKWPKIYFKKKFLRILFLYIK